MWYFTVRWARLRAEVLAEAPCCRECWALGQLVSSAEVDHITPHRGDPAKFWDRGNLQALCKAHHSRKTARERRRGGGLNSSAP